MDFIDSVLLFLQMRWAFCLVSALIIFIVFALSYPPLRSWFAFQFTDLWVSWFVIGRLIKEGNIQKKPNGFTGAEEELCEYYKTYAPTLSQVEFDEYKDYINFAGDAGGSPISWELWLLLGILVAAEALGFSYMLGKWMAMEASENTHVLLMFAIVTVLCVMMLMLTHFAGSQYSRTKTIRDNVKERKTREKRINDEFDPETQKQENRAEKKKLDHHYVALNKPQNMDADSPACQRALNRICKSENERGSYGLMWITALAIIVIAVASTWMRYNALEQDLTRETMLQQEESSTATDPFAMVLPDEVTESQSAADNKAFLEIQSASRQEGMAAFAMLAFIFVFTQIVGIITGSKFSMVGTESLNAYEKVGKFPRYSAYRDSFRRVFTTGRKRLKTLQNKLIENENRHIELNKTFDDYVNLLIADSEKTALQAIAKVSNPTPSAQESAPASQSTRAPASAETPQTPAVPSFEEIKAHLESLNDASKEKAYFQGLPDEAKTTEARALLQERILANI